ncbi:putative reverse transcriptase domain-containing protein, partial [Tanacetum coccineum]
MTITCSGITPEVIEELVNQRVEEALAAHEVTRAANALETENQSQNGSDGDNGNGGNGNSGNGNENPDENGERTIGTEAAFAMSWRELMKLMTEVYCPRNEIQKTKTELWNLTVKNNDLIAYTQRFQELTMMCTKMVPEEEDRVEKFIRGLPDNIQGNVIVAEPTRLQDAVRIANNLMDQKLKGYAVRNAENKRRLNNNNGNNRGQQPPHKQENTGVGVSYTTKDSVLLSVITGRIRELLRVLNVEHKDITERIVPKSRTKTVGTKQEFMRQSICPRRRSFVSNTFSALLDIIPSALDVSYAVELADGRTLEINNVLRGCTLGLLGHPFNIDLMPIDLGSFDVIIGMDWLAKNHVVIVYDEKIVRIPYENEILIVQGEKSDNEKKSTLSIISCVKAQKYMDKGCQLFLTQVTVKENKDESKEKRLEDVSTVRDFPEVFPEDLPGLPP